MSFSIITQSLIQGKEMSGFFAGKNCLQHYVSILMSATVYSQAFIEALI